MPRNTDTDVETIKTEVVDEVSGKIGLITHEAVHHEDV